MDQYVTWDQYWSGLRQMSDDIHAEFSTYSHINGDFNIPDYMQAFFILGIALMAVLIVLAIVLIVVTIRERNHSCPATHHRPQRAASASAAHSRSFSSRSNSATSSIGVGGGSSPHCGFHSH